MSIEEALIFPVTVATPALGVRIEIEGGQVCLHIGNDGGRGAPCLILVLPVDGCDTATLRPVIPLDAAMLDSHSRTPNATLPAPYAERFSAVEWRALDPQDPAHPTRLVLLLFNQSPLTGGVTVARGERHAAPATDVERLVQRIEALFAPGTRDPEMLRRGLVRLDPADLPMASGSKDEPPPFAGATFAFGSCQYPAGLLDATPPNAPLDLPGPADASMRRLLALVGRTTGTAKPSLLILAGDQIYADATAGLFDPRAAPMPAAGRAGRRAGLHQIDNRLRVPYENWRASPGTMDVLNTLPTRTMLDDHEIDDNWEPLPAGADPRAVKANTALQNEGVRAYLRYQRNDPGAKGLPQLWYAFEHRGLRFFMADTRTERDPREAAIDPLTPRIMSPQQHEALAAWLRAAEGRPSFVVSPSMLVPRRRTSRPTGRSALRSDAWDGYPGSMHAVLALLCRERLSNVVFLSGDEHLSSVVHAEVTDDAGHRAVLHSVHSSGLYAPYPFANSLEADFIAHDTWEFTETAEPAAPRYRVEVEVETWVPGDGFATLSVLPDGDAGSGSGSGWSIDVRFDRAAGAPATATLTAPAIATVRA